MLNRSESITAQVEHMAGKTKAAKKQNRSPIDHSVREARKKRER